MVWSFCWRVSKVFWQNPEDVFQVLPGSSRCSVWEAPGHRGAALCRPAGEVDWPSESERLPVRQSAVTLSAPLIWWFSGQNTSELKFVAKFLKCRCVTLKGQSNISSFIHLSGFILHNTTKPLSCVLLTEPVWKPNFGGCSAWWRRPELQILNKSLQPDSDMLWEAGVWRQHSNAQDSLTCSTTSRSLLFCSLEKDTFLTIGHLDEVNVSSTFPPARWFYNFTSVLSTKWRNKLTFLCYLSLLIQQRCRLWQLHFPQCNVTSNSS